MELHSGFDEAIVFYTMIPSTTESSVRIDVNQLPQEGSVYWRLQRSTDWHKIDTEGGWFTILPPTGHQFSRAIDLIYVPDIGDTGNNGIFDFHWTSHNLNQKGKAHRSFEFIVDGTKGASLNKSIDLGVDEAVVIATHSFGNSSQGSVYVRNFQYPDEGTVYWRYFGFEELHKVEPETNFHILKKQTTGEMGIERIQFVYVPAEGDTGFNGTFSYEVDRSTTYTQVYGQRVYKFDLHVSATSGTAIVVQEGSNFGSAGDELFELILPRQSFYLDGGAGYDTLKADIETLSNSGWKTVDIERFELHGSQDQVFSFYLGEGGSSRTADVTGTTSRVLVDMQSSGSMLLGGADTYLNALSGHEITTFDMASGSYAGTWNGRDLNNTYLDLRGVLSGNGNDTVFGSSASEKAALGAGTNYFDGRDGIDSIVVIGGRSEFTISKTADGHTVSRASNSAGEKTTVTNVERVTFVDSGFNEIGHLALDFDKGPGMAYRLYQAAFDRAPDIDGLGYWIRELDAEVGDLAWMAKNFIISDEFKLTYGSPETVSNEAFLTLLYNNVLDRNPDADGYAYWMKELDGGFARERVLASFSESLENRANVASAIEDGIWFV
jgi:hypothetical protein